MYIPLYPEKLVVTLQVLESKCTFVLAGVMLLLGSLKSTTAYFHKTSFIIISKKF